MVPSPAAASGASSAPLVAAAGRILPTLASPPFRSAPSTSRCRRLFRSCKFERERGALPQIRRPLFKSFPGPTFYHPTRCGSLGQIATSVTVKGARAIQLGPIAHQFSAGQSMTHRCLLIRSWSSLAPLHSASATARLSLFSAPSCSFAALEASSFRRSRPLLPPLSNRQQQALSSSSSSGLKGSSHSTCSPAPIMAQASRQDDASMDVSMGGQQEGSSGQEIGAAAYQGLHGEGEMKKFTNRLVKEQSPYLLQHAHNPVDWFPWGQEAFEKARKEQKLIFLSVGYSTCHWCHVMEVESFESEEVAALLNDGFVSIKVDREERPDVDKVYMTYVQATQGGGGWPMSVFLTPSLHPVVGGTYFPPEDKGGRIGFKSLLKKVRSVWENKREEVEKGSEQVMEQLQEATAAEGGTTAGAGLEEGLARRAMELCANQLASRFDSARGGFGPAPKFPRPSELNLLLLRQHQAEGGPLAAASSSSPSSSSAGTLDTEESKKFLRMALFTLQRMAWGGMHDHVGGGFHRYSVDEYWHVPHFEKMLYDQGQLASCYLDAFSISGGVEYAMMARDVLDYIRRDMTHAEGGGIFSAEDADSLEPEEWGGAERKKKEGAFYLWTTKEIEAILGPQRAQLFSAHYYCKPGGNCDLSPRSDPHLEFKGLNCLLQRQPVQTTAQKFTLPVEEVEALLEQSRRDLHAAREKRPRPHLDDKIIASWNGLTISALARASRILRSEPSDLIYRFPVDGCDPAEYAAAACKAARFVRSNLFDEQSGRLRRSFREGPSASWGFVDDYSFLVAALLDLFEVTADAQWLLWAEQLQAKQDELFLDRSGGGYFSTAEGDPSILLRMKEDYDGAEPSGNSVAALNLLRLAEMFGGQQGEQYRDTARNVLASFASRLSSLPFALPQMCCALTLFAAPSKRQVLIVGKRGEEGFESLLNAAFSVYEPTRVVIPIDITDESTVEAWRRINPHVLAMAQSKQSSSATAFICQNFACRAPTSDPAKVKELLQEQTGGAKVSTFKLNIPSA